MADRKAVQQTMSEHELLDIYDRSMNWLGTETREKVHREGYWHQTFHCWVYGSSDDEEDGLLLQLRHQDKDTFPGYLDISCAGHLLAGEKIEDGVRELAEELGVTAEVQDLEYCGQVRQDYVDGKLKDREMTHIYIYECGRRLEEYDFQKSEISGLFRPTIQEFMELISGRRDSVVMKGVLYDETTGELRSVSRRVSAADITPQTPEYYEVLFQRLAKDPG
ncbi:NUDIX domain-containing protein [Paenibacillus sp. F411]|uniref:NUDIX hydrolase n=1 Tax=Paenibacillus sp. F411 TaxID=2820239 RepID=UPI001AAE4C2F|nr:NUDIX domain-containing protein [Paenibacillus sp. F411]MBO2944340.1 NUDIX domain-containing protein [Paenibacillus sp. F411]